MMKYFSIQSSLDEKIMGKLPQLKEVIHKCNVSNDPNFINKFVFEKIKSRPILSNAVLSTNSKQTDLIEASGVGFSYGAMLISEKLKNLLANSHCFGVQFFPTYIIHKNQRNENYWQTHIYNIPYNLLDLKKTNIYKKNALTRSVDFKEKIEVSNTEDLLSKIKELEFPYCIFFKDVAFKDEMNLDYFFLRYFEGANQGIVSQRLKDKIEKQEITGIEFKPIEVSLNNWLGSGGVREKFYGNIVQMQSNGKSK